VVSRPGWRLPLLGTQGLGHLENVMINSASYSEPASGEDTHRLFGQTMGYVAATGGLFALGAYLGRDLRMSSDADSAQRVITRPAVMKPVHRRQRYEGQRITLSRRCRLAVRLRGFR
jgi:hypothetical protein